MLSVLNLTKYYGDFKAVDSVSFSVPRGKKVGLLGPNGAGKTTIIRIIIGILPKTSGEIILNDQVLDPKSLEWKSQFGVVPEVSSAYLDYSPLKNLLFSGGLYGLEKRFRKSKALELLKEFGLSEKMNIHLKKLSKGQKQRLNLCMALLHDPEIFFLDEPTTGLDIKSARFFRDKINEFSKAGKTVFLTTHNLVEADSLCDEIIVINHGRIITSGSPDDLRQKFLPTSKIEMEFYKIPENSSVFKELEIEYQIDLSNKRIIFFTSNPMEDFSKIHNFTSNRGLKVSHLEILSAPLEEVFLKILGES